MIALLFAAAVSIGPNNSLGPAIRAAAERCYAGQGSCMIQIEAGDHDLDRTVELCPGVEISGESEQHTRIAPMQGQTAFHILPFMECLKRGLPHAGFVSIERLDIGGQRTDATTYGVLAENHVRLERLWVHGFTQGIRIEATEQRPKPRGGNANNWSLDKVSVWYTDHAGIAVQGADVNVGLALQANVHSGVCEKWKAFPGLGACAGIIDNGFLGDTWVSPHVSNASGQPSYLMRGRNAVHVVVGGYAEPGDAPSYAEWITTVIGGLGHWVGPGLRIKGPWMSGAIFQNHLDPSNPLELRLGEATGTRGAFWTAAPLGPNLGYPLGMKYEPGPAQYRFDLANLNRAAFLRVQAVDGELSLGTARLKSWLFKVEN